ncbi:hypothetical protein SSCI18S_01802 [Sphingobium scionense]
MAALARSLTSRHVSLGNKRQAIHPAGFLAVPVGHHLFWSTARNPSLLIVLITARSATTQLGMNEYVSRRCSFGSGRCLLRQLCDIMREPVCWISAKVEALRKIVYCIGAIAFFLKEKLKGYRRIFRTQSAFFPSLFLRHFLCLLFPRGGSTQRYSSDIGQRCRCGRLAVDCLLPFAHRCGVHDHRYFLPSGAEVRTQSGTQRHGFASAAEGHCSSVPGAAEVALASRASRSRAFSRSSGTTGWLSKPAAVGIRSAVLTRW